MAHWYNVFKKGDVVIFKNKAPLAVIDVRARGGTPESHDIGFSRIGEDKYYEDWVYRNTLVDGVIWWGRPDTDVFDDAWDIIGYIPKKDYQGDNSKVLLIKDL